MKCKKCNSEMTRLARSGWFTPEVNWCSACGTVCQLFNDRFNEEHFYVWKEIEIDKKGE